METKTIYREGKTLIEADQKLASAVAAAMMYGWEPTGPLYTHSKHGETPVVSAQQVRRKATNEMV